MDLFIDQENLKPVFQALKERHAWGVDTLFVENGQFLKKGNLEFGMGSEDTALFYHHHPHDAEHYYSLSVRQVYECMVLLKKNKLPESDIIRETLPFSGKNVINIGKMMDKKEWLSDHWSLGLISSTAAELQHKVYRAGINRDMQDWLESKMEQRKPSFTHHEYRQFENGDKAGCKLRFEFDKKGAGYSFPGYELQLFVKTPIEHTVINGVHTGQLEVQMRKMDWQYGISETVSGILNGYKEADAIDAALTRLASDEKGAQIAMQLWNNHVPAGVWSKPDYIKTAEEKTDLYPRATFTADTHIEDAYHSLKDKHLGHEAVLADPAIKNDHRSITPAEETKVSSGKDLSAYERLGVHHEEQFNEGTSLLFKESQPGALQELLKQKSLEGNDYVAYDPLLPITAKDLRFFELDVDAQAFCKKNSDELHHLSFTTIDMMKQEMGKSQEVFTIGTAIENIEVKMKHADWSYDYSDDHRVWTKGHIEISGVKEELEKLCKVPGGGAIANELWNKYVPPYTVSKPDFLEKAMKGFSKADQPSTFSSHSAGELKTGNSVDHSHKSNQTSSKAQQTEKEPKQRYRRRLE